MPRTATSTSRFSGSYNDSELKSTVEPTAATGIVAGRRLPTVPKGQMAMAATAQFDMTSQVLGYVTGSFSYVGGDRFTQVGDLDLGRLDMTSFGANTIGGPLTQQFLTYDPILPSYSIVNARFGVLKGKWDVALYANNLTDERALLVLRPRARDAGAHLLLDQPAADVRTHGPRQFLENKASVSRLAEPGNRSSGAARVRL